MKIHIIGKILPKEIREKPGVKMGLALATCAFAGYSIWQILSKKKLSATAMLSAITAIAAINEAAEDISEVIEAEIEQEA